MPRYFFHVDECSPDVDGVVLADDAAAWSAAVEACGGLIREIDGKMQPGTSWRMLVTDSAGMSVFLLDFSSRTFGRVNRADEGDALTAL